MRSLLIDLRPLREHPTWRRLWFGTTLNTLGGLIGDVAVLYLVWEWTRSTALVGALALARAAPAIALVLVGGQIADRMDRRRLVLVCTAAQIVLTGGLAIQAALDFRSIPLLFGLVAARAAFASIAAPARRTFTPNLLGPALLPAGVALDVVAFQIGLLAGPALGGVIVGAWGVGWCLAIDALTYLGSLYGVLGLPAMRPEPSDEAPGWRRALAGAKHVMKMPVLRGAFATDLAATLLVMPVSLFPAINDLRFGGRPETLGLFMSAIAVGGVVASLLSGRSSRSRRPGRVMLAAAATWAVGLLGFGLAEVLWLALFSLAVAGAADTLSVTSRGTIVQLQTPDSLRGRVTALDHLVGATGPDVGNMRGGFVASLTSVPFALVSGPIACLAVLGIVAWRNPAVRRYTPRGGG